MLENDYSELQGRLSSEQPAKPPPLRPMPVPPHGYDPDTMNVNLKPFDFSQAAARAGLNVNGMPLAQGAKAVQAGGFQAALGQALSAVSNSQNQVAAMQREVQLGNPNVSIEETMVTMQKAQVEFQATLQVRNRLVQAYSDIMNMQV